MTTQFVVSTRLFPPELLEAVSCGLRPQFTPEIEQFPDGTARITLSGREELDPEQVGRLFKGQLTARAMEYWACAEPEEHTSVSPTTITLHSSPDGFHLQVRQRSRPPRIVLTIGCHQISWRVLLQMLSSMKGVQVILESTAPVDRYVVNLFLTDGATPDQIIQQLTAYLFSDEWHLPYGGGRA